MKTFTTPYVIDLLGEIESHYSSKDILIFKKYYYYKLNDDLVSTCYFYFTRLKRLIELRVTLYNELAHHVSVFKHDYEVPLDNDLFMKVYDVTQIY